MSTFSCMNCERLEDCPTVDEEKLMTGFYCGDWRPTHSAKVAARQMILNNFGSAGALTIMGKRQPTNEES